MKKQFTVNMMLDNLSLKIEKDALRLGSYILAVTEYCEENTMYDYHDMKELLHPCIIEKIKQEAIDKGFFPELKNKNKSNIFEFMEG